jgi:AraC-like DNA-binding protein
LILQLLTAWSKYVSGILFIFPTPGPPRRALEIMASLATYLQLGEHPERTRIEHMILEMESWPDIIVMVQEFAQQRTRISAQQKKMLGYDQTLWDTDFLSAITHPDDIYSINEKMASYLLEANKPFYNKEYPRVMKLFGRLLNHKGNYIPIEFSGVILQYNTSGAFQLGFGVYQDISGKAGNTSSAELCEEVTKKIETYLLEIKRFYHLIHPCQTNTPLPLPIQNHSNDSKIHIIDVDQLALKMKHGVEIQRLLRNYSSLKEGSASPARKYPSGVDDISFINKVIKIIEQHLSNTNLTTDLLARELNISRANLHRKIKMASGMPSAEWIRMVRLDRAAQLLGTKEQSVAQIAYMVGFDDSSYFSKCFRKQYGVTPSEYRKKVSGDI